MPLTVYADHRSGLLDDAIWIRAHLERGVKVWDRIASLRDPRYFKKFTSSWDLLLKHRRKHISIFDDTEDQISSLEEFNPTVIRSYPSSLEILANYSQNIDIDPKMILTSGEGVTHNLRKLFHNRLGGEVLDNYSSNELALIAWECKEHNGYHINVDSLFLEIIRDGEPVSPGEQGEIVVTKLFNYAMPLLRYKIGDIGILEDDACSCGVTFPRLKVVEGRSDDFLLTTQGKLVSPLIFFPYPFEKVEMIKQFRIIQVAREKMIIQLVCKNDFNASMINFDGIRKQIHEVFGDDMDVKFKIKDKLGVDSSGKIRKIISRINDVSS